MTMVDGVNASGCFVFLGGSRGIPIILTGDAVDKEDIGVIAITLYNFYI